MTFRVGIIGCGRIGVEFKDSHANAYFDCPDTDLVAVSDKDTKKNRVPEGLHYKILPTFYTDYLEMVKSKNLDIVSVCTPLETHCQIVCDIAPYVKAIYCEKPIALTLEDADKMIETCHKYNVILQVNHQRRFLAPKMRFSRDILETGTHAFDLLNQLWGEIIQINNGMIYFKNPLAPVVEIEYIDSQEHIFELDCTHNKERMILEGVKHLITCLELKMESVSSGENAREALHFTLEFKEWYERDK